MSDDIERLPSTCVLGDGTVFLVAPELEQALDSMFGHNPFDAVERDGGMRLLNEARTHWLYEYDTHHVEARNTTGMAISALRDVVLEMNGDLYFDLPGHERCTHKHGMLAWLECAAAHPETPEAVTGNTIEGALRSLPETCLLVFAGGEIQAVGERAGKPSGQDLHRHALGFLLAETEMDWDGFLERLLDQGGIFIGAGGTRQRKSGAAADAQDHLHAILSPDDHHDGWWDGLSNLQKLDWVRKFPKLDSDAIFAALEERRQEQEERERAAAFPSQEPCPAQGGKELPF